ncbi:MAG: hypothetical protein VCA73_01395 [Roseibacillus sp.]|jgi:hypothetical protein
MATECADFQSVEREGLRPISDRATSVGGREHRSMDVIRLMVVALAGWTNQQEHVPED